MHGVFVGLYDACNNFQSYLDHFESDVKGIFQAADA